MAWTSPRTWIPGEKLLSSVLNVQVRDNLLALKEPPTVIIAPSGPSYSTTSTSYVDIDASLQATLVTGGGRLLVAAAFSGSVSPNQASIQMRFLLDGVALTFPATALTNPYTTFVYWTDALTAGTHTVKPQWQLSLSGPTATMSGFYLAVREVS